MSIPSLRSWSASWFGQRSAAATLSPIVYESPRARKRGDGIMTSVRTAAKALSIPEVYPRGTMRAVKRTIIVLLLGFLATSAFGASFLSDEQALRRLEREQAVATYDGDAGWFRNHVSDDYVLITGSGVVKTKAQLIAELEKGVVMEPYEPTEVTVRAHDDVA